MVTRYKRKNKKKIYIYIFALGSRCLAIHGFDDDCGPARFRKREFSRDFCWDVPDEILIAFLIERISIHPVLINHYFIMNSSLLLAGTMQ